ncbi:MAG: DUF2218 domain-containing protein [Solirubrobacteraceae bacterium]
MPSSIAHVTTTKPTPYLKQLCKHFGHKSEVTFDDERGEIHLPSGVCALDATADGTLTLIATATDAESLATLERVIGGHLERFGARDELAVSWSAA